MRGLALACAAWCASLALLVGMGTGPTSVQVAGAVTTTPSIAFKAATSANNGAGASNLTISGPAGETTGDVLLAQLVVNNATSAITPPTGWTLVQRTQSTSSVVMASYVKVAGSAEPASYTFSFGTAQPATGGIADYTGVDTTRPIDASSGQYNPNTATVSFAQLTTTQANDFLVAVVGVTGNTSVTPGTGFAERYDANDLASANGKTAELADLLDSAAGLTSVGPASEATNAGSNLAQLIALSPTGAVAPPSTPTPTPTPTSTPVPAVSGGITLRGQTTATNGAGASSLTLAGPAGETAGDVLLAQLVVNNATSVITPPTGWTLVQRTQSTSSVAMASYVKVAGSAEPVSYTFSFGTAQPATGGIADYTGVDTTRPIDASSGQYNPNTATVTFAQLTTTRANDLLVAVVGVSGNTSVTPGTGFTERYDANDLASANGKTAELSDLLDSATGLTSVGPANEATNAGSNLAQLIALSPTGAVVPPSTPTPTSTPAPAGDPVIAAGGDVACDPADPAFNAGAGTAAACHARATSALLSSTHPTVVLALGDEQYENGALAAFQQSYDPTWGLAKSITHPIPGNHEYNTAGGTGYYAYFGAAAGDPAKGYYSFDLGAWHIVALNGECGSIGGCGAGSAQETFLKSDLAAHPNLCTLAAWHEPRFSSGIGGNDPTYTAFWQDLYAAGAELILNGHEHMYERFAPQDPTGKSDPARGVVELVAGTGGASLFNFGVVQPNSLVRNNTTFGVLLLTLHATSYDWQFVPQAGQTFTDAGTAACH